MPRLPEQIESERLILPEVVRMRAATAAVAPLAVTPTRHREGFQVLRLAGYDESLTGDFVYCWER